MTEQIPVFATNRVAPQMTVGEEVRRLFRVNREALANVPSAAIATAYINPAGFLLLADELEKMPRIRILLGADPIPDPLIPLDTNTTLQQRINEALTGHTKWLKAERDALGFEHKSTTSAKRLVEWLRAADTKGEPVVEIRRYTGGFLHGKTYISNHPTHPAYLAGSSNLTLAGLTRNAELNVGASGTHGSTQQVIDWFDECWADSEPYDLAALYEPLWAEHSPWSVFLRMLLARYGEHLDDEQAGPTRFELTRFQADGVKRMRRLLEEIGGVLVADEVGLGKTYLALEVIAAATEQQRQRVLIATPAALKASVWDPVIDQYDISRRVTVHSYEEIRSRMDPEHPDHQNFYDQAEDAALVIVDEAHNLRNASAARSEALDRIILAGRHPKKVVLLTATPVNNSLIDLETLVKYFIRDDARFASIGIPSIRRYIRDAQGLDPEALTPAHLFDLMDQVAVRRTRKFVKDNYKGETIMGPGGKKIPVEFPDADVRRVDYQLDGPGDDLVDAVTYALDIPEEETHVASFSIRRSDPKRLLLARYVPSRYLKSEDLNKTEVSNMGLLRSALLKRLESSPTALAGTLGVLIQTHSAFLAALDKGTVLIGGALRDYVNSESEDLEEIIAGLDEDTEHQATPASLYDADLLKADVERDLALIKELQSLAIAAAHDGEPKVEALLAELKRIVTQAAKPAVTNAPTGDRRKVIVFSTYADTIRDLHERLTTALSAVADDSPLAVYRGRLAPAIIGEFASGKRGGIDQPTRAKAVANFAPRTAGRMRNDGTPVEDDLYDLLLTTDVLAEGVNLQQAGHIVNYDLPWNPMRIVQRHGRVDRIGSQHKAIELNVFFPAEHLDEFLGLEQILVRKLKQADAAIGAGKVLPGVSHYPPQEHYDPDDIVGEIEELIEQSGGSAAGSGEEYRRRLVNAFDANPSLRGQLEDLPYGIGSGFVNPAVSGHSFVFCMKMGDTGHTWFRNVNTDESWQPAPDEEGRIVVDDTLISLVTADPGKPDRARSLPASAFQAAYEAWALAQADAHEEWMHSTDPNALVATPPASFRDARELVKDSGGHLGAVQMETIKRLHTVPTAKARKAMRAALRTPGESESVIEAIITVLDDFGIQPAEKVEPLPVIALEDVRLIAWMAVEGTKPTKPVAKDSVIDASSTPDVKAR
ncbi:SNF2-related protein [Terrimesophilobacter mesophilus]|uniref:Helicase n=1 Tax=Terrimesophilobacter mesophilus TaxID=433647 RepID=A0A4V3I9M1_9MICO|nr:SNF2-related protein [Terrimesophilobacter mesophilus]TFB80038.1 helicase [Terrimesophilobacter mesophilus]